MSPDRCSEFTASPEADHDMRSWYARDACFGLAHDNAERLRWAFQQVAREDHLPDAPWLVKALKPGIYGRVFKTSDPRDLYHDVLVSIIEELRINNGQPSLWAEILGWAGVGEGMHVHHSGAGMGYYTAILCYLVGNGGAVWWNEANAELEARAKGALTAYGNAIPWSDGGLASSNPPRVNIGIISYGTRWLSRTLWQHLAAEGTIVMPLTGADGRGALVKIIRDGDHAEIRRGVPCSFVADTNYHRTNVAEDVAANWKDMNSARIPIDPESADDIDLIAAMLRASDSRTGA